MLTGINNNRDIKMNRKTYKKLITMAKKIYAGLMTAACLLALAILCAPCLLIFSVGKDGELTVWNLVGVVWMVVLFGVFKYKSR